MTVMRAVVKYPRDASDAEKIRELRDGLGTVAAELAALGCRLGDIETWLDDALVAAWDEYEARERA